MKNRGFTLIELLAIIVVMGIVGVITAVSLNLTMENTNQKKCDDFVKEIEDAACVYAGLSNQQVVCNRDNCEFKLNLLVTGGLIESEKDACTGNSIDLEETVKVTWDETTGEKKCEYNGVKEYER